MNWLKDKLMNLGFNDTIMNRLINFLIKYGTVEKIMTEMKNLTKNKSQVRLIL